MKNKIFTFSIFLTIFLSSYRFFSTPFEGYFHYLIFLILLPIFLSKYGLPTTPFKILFLPLFFGLIQVYAENNTIELFAKIFIGVLLSTSFYYYVMLAYEFDVEYLFGTYLKWAYIIILIGVVQLISFYLGFKPGYDYSWLLNKWGVVVDPDEGLRVNSIFSESSQFAIVVSPAVFIAIYNLLMRKRIYYKNYQSVLIVITVILSTSSMAIVGIFIAIALITLNHGKFINLLVAILFLVIISRLFYTYLPNFQSRVDSATGLWIDKEFTIENVNNSSFILYNHWHVAVENFKNYPLFGTGLGSHPVAFDKYSLTLLDEIIDVTFNKADANSMFLRLLSETGLMGVLFILYIIFKSFVRRDFNYPDSNYWIISNAILVLIILYLLRQGNYFINGFPFFVWMYYYTKKVYENSLLEGQESEITNPDPEENEVKV